MQATSPYYIPLTDTDRAIQTQSIAVETTTTAAILYTTMCVYILAYYTYYVVHD